MRHVEDRFGVGRIVGRGGGGARGSTRPLTWEVRTGLSGFGNPVLVAPVHDEPAVGRIRNREGRLATGCPLVFFISGHILFWDAHTRGILCRKTQPSSPDDDNDE